MMKKIKQDQSEGKKTGVRESDDKKQWLKKCW
jgi:hypothetical protein